MPLNAYLRWARGAHWTPCRSPTHLMVHTSLIRRRFSHTHLHFPQIPILPLHLFTGLRRQIPICSICYSVVITAVWQHWFKADHEHELILILVYVCRVVKPKTPGQCFQSNYRLVTYIIELTPPSFANIWSHSLRQNNKHLIFNKLVKKHHFQKHRHNYLYFIIVGWLKKKARTLTNIRAS
jgi:hypothetical protein